MPKEFVEALVRTLKPGADAAMHTALSNRKSRQLGADTPGSDPNKRVRFN